MSVVKHITGPFEDNKQECIMCGEVICDYTHAMFPAGSTPPKGWPIGELYISGVNPKVFCTSKPEGEKIVDCTPI